MQVLFKCTYIEGLIDSRSIAEEVVPVLWRKHPNHDAVKSTLEVLD